MTSPVGSNGPRGAAGFSLVELLAVAAIMGLLAGVAAISLRGLRTPALASAANEVASALKTTRQMAIASGRNMYLVIPVASSSLNTNPYRSYAIFEELKEGQEMRTPSSDNANPYPTNTGTNSWFIPRTDWRVLPEGAVFYGMVLRTNTTSTTNETGFGPIGQPENRSGSFRPFTNMIVRQAANPGAEYRDLTNVPYLRVTPTGRFYTSGYLANVFGAGLRVAQGTVRDGMILVTDTNSQFLIETDSQSGRILVRKPESYRP